MVARAGGALNATQNVAHKAVNQLKSIVNVESQIKCLNIINICQENNNAAGSGEISHWPGLNSAVISHPGIRQHLSGELSLY
jgi:hypothetical protein